MSTDNALVNFILTQEPGFEYVPALDTTGYTRAVKSGAIRILKNRGFITAKPDTTANIQVWVRTDKNASEWTDEAPHKPRGRRGPNRRRFHNMARRGELETFVDGSWTSPSYNGDAGVEYEDVSHQAVTYGDFTVSGGSVRQVSDDPDEYILDTGNRLIRIRELVQTPEQKPVEETV